MTSALTLEDTEIDEQVWKVNISWLTPAKARRSRAIARASSITGSGSSMPTARGSSTTAGFSNTGSDGGKLGFEYLFVDAPGKPSDYQLVYETPSRVITIPLEFEFKDIPLP